MIDKQDLTSTAIKIGMVRDDKRGSIHSVPMKDEVNIGYG